MFVLLRSQLAQKAHLLRFFRIVAIRGMATGLQFAAQVAVSRLLGPAATGALALTQSSVLLFGTIGSAGLPWLALRRSAQDANGEAPHDREQWLEGAWLIGFITAAVAALIGCAQHLAIGSHAPSAIIPAMAAGVFFYAIAKIYIECLKGVGKQDLSTALEFILPPGAVILCALIARFDGRGQGVLPTVGYALAFAPGAWMLTSHALKNKLSVVREGLNKYRRSVPELLSICSVQVSNQIVYSAPIILLAQLGGLREAGILGIITRLVGMTSTFSGIIATHYTHSIIQAFRAADGRSLRRIYVQSLAINAIASAAILLPLIIFPHHVLQIFGKSFVDDKSASYLALLSALMLARQFTGLNELHLTLTGNSKFDALSQLISVIVLTSIITINPKHVMNYVLAFGIASLTRGVISAALTYNLVLRSERS